MDLAIFFLVWCVLVLFTVPFLNFINKRYPSGSSKNNEVETSI